MTIRHSLGWFAAVMTSCLLAPQPAQADLEQDLHAFFWVNTWETDTAVAFVTIDPDAPVLDVRFESPSCDIGPMSEVEPGVWTGEGPPGSSYTCFDATATVILGETGPGPVPCPFVGLSRVTITGGAYTDSYDPSAAPWSPETAGEAGHVCSNGRIRMTGNATVHGDARTGPRGSVSLSGNAAVTGMYEELPEPLSADPVDPGAAVFVNDNLQVPFSSSGRYPLDDRGRFRLSGKDHVTLAPGTYFFTSFKLSGQSSLHLEGPTVIYVAGKFDASGGSIVNERRLPSDLQVFAMGQRVKLSGHSDLYAHVHAPDALIQRTGGAHFYGTLLGEALALTGNGGLHHDEGGAPSGEPTSFSMEWVYDE